MYMFPKFSSLLLELFNVGTVILSERTCLLSEAFVSVTSEKG